MLTVGSLFSGIGGFELGLERTNGFKVEWQCEIDSFCLKVLEKHWPDVKRFTDIKKMGIEEDIPYVDVICGGFPCQDISVAGKGAGIYAERSGLWWEMLRVVRLVRPKYIIVENVAALLNRGLDEVLGSLAESGYNAEWDCLPASAFGAPHQRDRLFIVAYTNIKPSTLRNVERGYALVDAAEGEQELGFSGNPSREVSDTSSIGTLRQQEDRSLLGNGRDESVLHRIQTTKTIDANGNGDSQRKGEDATNPNGKRQQEQRRAESIFTEHSEPQFCDWWKVEPDVGRVANGIPDRVHRLRALGNAIVPQIPQWIGYQILEFEKMRQ